MNTLFEAITATQTQMALSLTSGNDKISLVPNLAGADYNYHSMPGDKGLFWSDGNQNSTSGFVIAPWQGSWAGLSIAANGNVGIGTNQASEKLHVNGNVFVDEKVFIGGRKLNDYSDALLQVNGTIAMKAGIVSVTQWSDYVFEKEYNLLPLYELENYIKLNKHLPDIPSESEVLLKGIEVGEMNALLLKKIEELTLYVIELEKRINSKK